MDASLSFPIRLAGAVLCLSACVEPTPGESWHPVASAREVRRLQRQITEQETERLTLPEARTVAQSHQRMGFHGRAAEPAWIMLDLGRRVTPEEVVLFSARVADPAPDDPVGGFPSGVRVLISDTADAAEFRTMVQWKEETPGSGGDLPWLRLKTQGLAGRFLRVELQSGHVRGRSSFFTLGEIVVIEDGMNRALGAVVTASPGIDNAPRWMESNLTDGFLWCGNLHGTARASSNGFHSRIESHVDAVPKWVEVDLGQVFALDEVRLVPARPADFADVTGFGFPPSFRVLLDPEEGGASDSERLLFKSSQEGFANPGDAAVCLSATGRTARRVRVQADQLWQRSSDYIFALAELQVFSGGSNVALGKPVQYSDVVEVAASWQPMALVDGFASQRELLSWHDWLAGASRRLELDHALAVSRLKLGQMEARAHKDLLRSVLVLVMGLMVLAAAIFYRLHRRQRQVRQKMRESIARDLHDEIGSHLSHLALLAESGDHAKLPAIASGARELQFAMRDLVWLLDPGNGDARDFSSRLRSTCNQLLTAAIPEVVIEAKGSPPARQLPLDWTREVLLFTREAVTNAARHSRANEAKLLFDWTTTEFIWELWDNGQGFEELAQDFQSGAGLRNLRHRATQLKAKLMIESHHGRGTWIRLHCPLPQGT